MLVRVIDHRRPQSVPSVPRIATLATVMLTLTMQMPRSAVAGDPPCDRYPEDKQAVCRTIWKQLNDQAVGEMSRFGLEQQRRRDAGQITAEQHLAENMAFIKQATQNRLKRLEERMARE
jgi:hypothetical protein